MNNSTLAVLATLTLFASCSKIKDFESKTNNMEKSTSAVSQTTQDMKDVTTTMYQQIRNKESEETRNRKFAILNDDEVDAGAKFAAAAIYFKGFEFQLWTGTGADNKDFLYELYLDAANEFTRRMVDMYEQVNLEKMSPTNSGRKHAMETSFYALAGSMHLNHPYQEDLARKLNIPTTSFYDLVKGALLKDHTNSEALKPYEEVLTNGMYREIMIELVKARVDILSALALKNLTDKKEMSIKQKAKALIFIITKGKLGEIDLPEVVDGSNHSTRIWTEKYLDGALKAKRFLKLIGVEKGLEKTLASAFSNLDFVEKAEDKDQLLEKIKTEIKELTK
ncbi:MAG: hypothetical protein AB7I27_13280 [Bacteriovoracaceae bacterium]